MQRRRQCCADLAHVTLRVELCVVCVQLRSGSPLGDSSLETKYSIVLRPPFYVASVDMQEMWELLTPTSWGRTHGDVGWPGTSSWLVAPSRHSSGQGSGGRAPSWSISMSRRWMKRPWPASLLTTVTMRMSEIQADQTGSEPRKCAKTKQTKIYIIFLYWACLFIALVVERQ